MGILDHRSTWRYKVGAPPEACVTAFTKAFAQGGGLIAKAKWEVARTRTGATATYAGRRGLGALGPAFSQIQKSEEEGAIGSQVVLEIEQDAGRTTCAVWLAEHGTKLGFTSDARFIRPYFGSVQSELRALDPALEVAKS
jgi:hypothetical protein